MGKLNYILQHEEHKEKPTHSTFIVCIYIPCSEPFFIFLAKENLFHCFYCPSSVCFNPPLPPKYRSLEWNLNQLNFSRNLYIQPFSRLLTTWRIWFKKFKLLSNQAVVYSQPLTAFIPSTGDSPLVPAPPLTAVQPDNDRDSYCLFF
jgi:hypothetical protein